MCFFTCSNEQTSLKFVGCGAVAEAVGEAFVRTDEAYVTASSTHYTHHTKGGCLHLRNTGLHAAGFGSEESAELGCGDCGLRFIFRKEQWRVGVREHTHVVHGVEFGKKRSTGVSIALAGVLEEAAGMR